MFEDIKDAIRRADLEADAGWSRPNKVGPFHIIARLCPEDVLKAIETSDDAMAAIAEMGYPDLYIDTEWDYLSARYMGDAGYVRV